ncbi:MAG: DUF4221 family protein [Bacteroidales bacterium]|jgi:hypothetical protein|nr:DUF4221 family protein [Bacteroidales bacterium]
MKGKSINTGIIIGLFSITLLFSCNTKDQNSGCSLQNISFIIDSILPDNIKTITDLRIIEHSDSVFIYIMDDSKIIVLNYKPNDISLYDSIYIPNEISECLNSGDYKFETFYPISPNNIILFYSKLHIAQNESLIINYHRPDKKFDTLLHLKNMNVILYSDLSYESNAVKYDSENDNLYIRCQYKNIDQDDNNLYYLSKLNIPTKEFKVLPISYPNEFENYKNMATYHNLEFDVFDEKVITSFSFPHTVLIYNTKENTTFFKKMDTKNCDDIPVFSDNDLENSPELQHEASKLHFKYTSILFDKYKNNYLRFYEASQNEINENGEYSTFKDKKIGFALFNNSYKKTSDCILGTKRELNPLYKTFTVTSYGILYFSTYKYDTNRLYFTLINY